MFIMRKSNYFFIVIILLALILGFTTKSVSAETNTIKTAYEIPLNITYYDAIVPDKSDVDVYYKIYLEEGEIYSIILSNENTPTDEWDRLDSYLCYGDNTGSQDTIKYSDCGDVLKTLYKPSYSGYYYIKNNYFYPEINIKYSIHISKYDVKGTIVTDEYGNTYSILDNDTMELIKSGSQKSKDFQISNYCRFKAIGDYDTIESLSFDVTSIGQNAFKGNTYLKEVYLTDGIQKIKSGAFQNCKNLKYVKFYMYSECELNFVGKNAFKGTKKGIKFSFPDKVKKYKKLFKNCGAKKPKYY